MTRPNYIKLGVFWVKYCTKRPSLIKIGCFFFRKWYHTDRESHILRHPAKIHVRFGARGGESRIIFWRGVRPEIWNPYPYLRIFLPQKTADLKPFFEIFANRDPFLRVFLPQNGWFYNFFAIFAKWDPLLRIFLSKMGPMSKDFCWKSNPFGRHIPVCLNMWVPPRDLVKPPGLPFWVKRPNRLFIQVTRGFTLLHNSTCPKKPSIPLCLWGNPQTCQE